MHVYIYMCVCIYIYVYMYKYIYKYKRVYVYVYRERERERECRILSIARFGLLVKVGVPLWPVIKRGCLRGLYGCMGVYEGFREPARLHGIQV